MNGRSTDFLQILDDDPVNLAFRNSYYESNNVVVRVQGRSVSRKALLISSHFDSTPFSPGVTDDGISVAVMVELIRSLIFNPILDHDVVFNFNNGEEMWLWGGFAFTQHPWFADIVGFLNLEGTGAASGTRAMLFRTNSYHLMESFTKRAPRPHSSVILNDLMRYVGSDTDYRPYVTVGGLPGADFAFYSYRYLYHTPRDDLSHADGRSVQHFGDNVLATVIELCTGDRLSNLERASKIANYSNPLPGPGFSYYDILGITSVMTPWRQYIAGMAVLLTVVIVGSVVKVTKEVKQRGVRRAGLLYIRPLVESYLSIWITILGSGLVVFVMSRIKSAVNRASTYGHPGWNLAWVVPISLATMVLMQSLWPKFAVLVRLRRKPGSRYSLLPSATGPVDHDDSEEEDESPLIPGPPIIATERIATGPSARKWLPPALLGFWTTMLLVALVLAAKGINAAYILYDYALFALLSIALSTLITHLVQRWWRADVRGTLDETADDLGPTFKRRVMEGWNRDRWAFDLFVASLIPLVLTLDIGQIFFVALPSLVAEGLKDWHVDLVFWGLVVLGSLNVLPSFQLVNRKVVGLVLLGLGLVPFIVSCALFPFSVDRPQKIVYGEVWDVSNKTSAVRGTEVSVFVLTTRSGDGWVKSVSGGALDRPKDNWKCEWAGRYDQCVADGFESPTILGGDGRPWEDPTELIDVSATFKSTPIYSNQTTKVVGKIVGPPGSRICSVQILPAAVGVWIDPEHAEDWVTMNGTHPVPGVRSEEGFINIMQDGLPVQPMNANGDSEALPPTFVFLREFKRNDRRFEVDYLFTYNANEAGDDGPVVRVECYLGGESSPTFRSIMGGGIPEWQTLTHARYGVLSIRKDTLVEK
ncbi:hypothetical protein HK097_007478 [Rhizophlyctis rosea]|uniref:Peptide hydrolase n=1 Tax=Rhizophlyctis rosea TaxID=64517 RepID=A0AAD5X9H1_9FUNG|nr:hypothetical protein HK097_007478 [Rhizophlyctis rosea]